MSAGAEVVLTAQLRGPRPLQAPHAHRVSGWPVAAPSSQDSPDGVPGPASAVAREGLLAHKDANPTWQSPGSVAALLGHCIQPFPGPGSSLTVLCPPDDGVPDSPQNRPKWSLRLFREGAGCLGNLRMQVQFFVIYEPTGRGLLLGLLTNHPP